MDSVLNIAEQLPNLKYLSLLKNPACPNEFTGNDREDYQKYRFYVIFRLQSLKFLDSQPVTAVERKEALKRGKFSKTVKIESTAPTSSEQTSSIKDEIVPQTEQNSKGGRNKKKKSEQINSRHSPSLPLSLIFI